MLLLQENSSLSAKIKEMEAVLGEIQSKKVLESSCEVTVLERNEGGSAQAIYHSDEQWRALQDKLKLVRLVTFIVFHSLIPSSEI